MYTANIRSYLWYDRFTIKFGILEEWWTSHSTIGPINDGAQDRSLKCFLVILVKHSEENGCLFHSDLYLSLIGFQILQSSGKFSEKWCQGFPGGSYITWLADMLLNCLLSCLNTVDCFIKFTVVSDS